MTRSPLKLGIMGLGAVVVLGGLWGLTRGQAEAGAAGGTAGGLAAEEPVESPPEVTAHLVEVQDRVEPLREAVAQESGAAASPAPALELASVSGTVQLPRGFVPTEPVDVFAWPVGEARERAPLTLRIAANASSWTFEELPFGAWVFTARAAAKATSGDHCAWGKSREFSVESAGEYDGLLVPLTEFGVRALVTDMNGMPLAGIDVIYRLNHLDSTAGEVRNWTAPRGKNEVSVQTFSNGIVSFETLSGSLNALGYGSGSAGRVEIGRVTQAPQEPPASSELHFDEEELSRLFLKAVSEAQEEAGGGQVVVERGAQGGWLFNVTDSGGVAEEIVMEEEEEEGEEEGEEEPVEPPIPATGRATTDAAGRVWIALPGPGEVTVWLPRSKLKEADTDPGFIYGAVQVELTSEAPIGEASLALERAAALMGRLVGTDGHVKGITAFLTPMESGNSDSVNTNDKGFFKFAGKKPGKYIFYARSGGESGQDFSANRIVELTGGSIYQLDDVLTASSNLTGMVTGPDGQPKTGAKVIAYGANNRSLTRTARTDEFGVFTITGMYAVEYTLEVSGQSLAEGAAFYVPPAGGTARVGTLVLEPSASKGQ